MNEFIYLLSLPKLMQEKTINQNRVITKEKVAIEIKAI